MSGGPYTSEVVEAVFQTVATTAVTLELSLGFALQFLGLEIYSCF